MVSSNVVHILRRDRRLGLSNPRQDEAPVQGTCSVVALEASMLSVYLLGRWRIIHDFDDRSRSRVDMVDFIRN